MATNKGQNPEWNRLIPPKWQDAAWEKGRLSDALIRSARDPNEPSQPGNPRAASKNTAKFDDVDLKAPASPRTQAKTDPIAATADKNSAAKNPAEKLTETAHDKNKPGEPHNTKPADHQPAPKPPHIKSHFAAHAAAGLITPAPKAEPKEPISEAKALAQLGVGGQAGRILRERKDLQNDDDTADERQKQKDEEFRYLMGKLQDQQEEDFKRSMDAALEATEERIRELEHREHSILNEILEIDRRRGARLATITECGESVDRNRQRLEDLQYLAGVSNEHDDLARIARQAEKESNLHEEKIKSLEKFKITTIGKDTYFETTGENGPTFYKIGKDRKPEEIKDPVEIGNIMSANLKPTFMRRAADGSIEYLNKDGEKLDQSKIDQINQFLNASGKKPEDVMVSYDEYKKVKEDPQGIAAQQNWDRYRETATESEDRLRRLSQHFGIPVENLRSLPVLINETKDALEKDEARLKAEVDALAKDDKRRAELEKELAGIRTELKATNDYRDRLLKGEFKDKKQLLENMPSNLKGSYQEKLAATQNNKNDANSKTQEFQSETNRPSLFQKSFKAKEENRDLLEKSNISTSDEPIIPKPGLFKAAFQKIDSQQPLAIDNTSRASGTAAASLNDGQKMAGSDKQPSTQFHMAATGAVIPASVNDTPEEEHYISVARSPSTSAARPG